MGKLVVFEATVVCDEELHVGEVVYVNEPYGEEKRLGVIVAITGVGSLGLSEDERRENRWIGRYLLTGVAKLDVDITGKPVFVVHEIWETR